MRVGCTYFRFLGELNYFLPDEQKERLIRYSLNGSEAIKHSIEVLGVPHPEVGMIEVNGEPVLFDYHLQVGDKAVVFPWTAQPPVGDAGRLRPPLSRPLCFVADAHLGQLARYLRLLGFDTLYENDYDDPHLAEIAGDQARILLTRDRGLLKRRRVVYGYCVRGSDPRTQLVDLLQRYDVVNDIAPWRRCLNCNGYLQKVDKGDVSAMLEPKTRLYYNEFQQCQDCRRVYWRGSHYERMQAFVEAVIVECTVGDSNVAKLELLDD